LPLFFMEEPVPANASPTPETAPAPEIITPPAEEAPPVLNATSTPEAPPAPETIAPPETPEAPPAEIIPPPDETITPPAETTPLPPEPQSFFRSLVHNALAQSDSNQTINSNDGFLEITYSLDGANWRLLGRVNALNYENFTPEIPVASWQDIRNLQIAVSAKTTLDAQPEVFLDGIWLDIEYDATMVEVVSNNVAAIGDVAQDIINQVADKLGIGEGQAPNSAPQTSVAEPPKKIKPIFSITGNKINSVKLLPKFTADMIREVGGENALKGENSELPDYAINESKDSLVISGACQKYYFVVLLYKNPDDYKFQPNLSVVNTAEPCQDGRFSYNLKNATEKIPAGDYYLLIAEEDKTGPWIPVSAVMPIKIDFAEEK